MPVSEVSSADVLEILSPIWHVKPDMAGKLRQHMRALPHRKVPAAIRTVQASTGAPGVKLAFEFLVLTAARWAEWSEIDGDQGVWTVPAQWTKANRRCRLMDDLAGCLAGPAS